MGTRPLAGLLAHRVRLTLPTGPRVLVLNYTGAEANWGCVATSKGLLRLIRQAYPGARIVTKPLDSEPHPERLELPDDPSGFDAYLAPRLSTDARFRWHAWADVIVLNGEATIHEWADARAHPEPLLRLLEAYAGWRFIHKPVLAVNQSVHFQGERFGDWVRAAFGGCRYVAVREMRSLARLQSLGLRMVDLVPDAAFLTDAAPRASARRWLADHGIAPGYVALFLGESVAREPLFRIAEMVIALMERLQRQVVLFAAPWPDTEVARYLKATLGTPVVGLESPERLVGLLREASIGVTGRWHAAIFLALAGTPFVPLHSTTDKNAALTELLEYPMAPERFERVGNDRIVALAAEVLERRDELHGSLRVNTRRLVEIARRGFPRVSGERNGEIGPAIVQGW